MTNRSFTKKTVLLYGALIALALVLPTAIGTLLLPKTTQAAWFDPGFGYRQRIALSNGSGSTLTDYQINITLNTSNLITNGKMQSDCDDIRITDIGGKVLPYWIEEDTAGCNTASTSIWIKVASIPTTGSNVFLYYGNPSANTGQNGNLVFPFFDDFNSTSIDTTKWTIKGSTSNITVSGGYADIFITDLTTYGDVSNGLIAKTAASAQGTIIEAGTKDPNGTNNNHVVYVGLSPSASSALVHFDTASTHGMTIYQNTSSDFIADSYGGTRSITTATLGTTSSWHRYSISYTDNSNAAFFRDGTQQYTRTTDSHVPDTALYPVLGGTDYNNAGDYHMYHSYVFVRKYASTEPTTANQSEEVGPGMAAEWKLDEGQGQTAQDSTSNNNDGTLGATTGSSTDDPTWLTEDQCVRGKCLRFDGGDYLTMGNPSKLNFGTNDFTFSVWIKTNTTVRRTIFSKYTASPDDGYLLDVLANGKARVVFSDNNSSVYRYVDSSKIVNDNRWHHIVAVRSSTNLDLYIDGVLLEDTQVNSGAASNSDSTANFTIGYPSYSGSTYFLGSIDEPRIYPYARSATQVQADYNSGAAKLGGTNQPYLSNGLVGYWPMDEVSWNGTAGEVRDKSGNNNHGTAVNGAAITGGKFGNAASFDGTNDVISIPDSTSLAVSNGFTISYWVQRTSGNELLQKSGSYGTKSGGTWTGYRWGGPEGHYSTSTLSSTVWKHVTATYDLKEHKTYVNGVLESTQADIAAAVPSGAALLYLGGNGSSSFSNARLDEVRLYNRTLSPDEVRDLYNYAPGPVGHWKMDEINWNGTAGEVVDSSGNGNNGVSVNGLTTTQGKYGKTGNFDGSDDYLEFPNTSFFNIQSALTISAWVKTSDNQGAVVAKNDATDPWNGYILSIGGISANGRICYWPGNYSSYSWNCGTRSVNDGSWHYVTIIHSGVNVSYFVDGILDGSSTVGARVNNSSGTLRIGNQGDNIRLMQGLIDDVKIYNYARTQEQILQDMQADAPPDVSGNKLPDPLAYYSLDEQQGQTANNKGVGTTAFTGTLGASSTASSDDPTWKTKSDCKVNGCASFDGTADFISLPNNSLDTQSVGAVCSWVYFDQAADNGLQGAIFSYSDNAGLNNKYSLYISDSGTDNTMIRGTFRTNTSSNQTDYYTGNNAIARQTWTHLCFNQDGNGVDLFINGIQKTWTTASVGTGLASDWFDDIASTAEMATIGNISDNSPDSFFPGKLDEVKIYSTPLSTDQIAQDFNAGASLNFGSTGNSEASLLSDGAGNPPVVEWNMDEKTGSALADSSGNGITGTLNNSPTWVKGKTGSALNFSATATTSVTSADPGTMASGSYSLWVKPSTINAMMGWIDSNFDIFQWNTNILYFRAGNQSSVSIANWTPDTWHHITMTWNGTTYYGYIDGAQVTSGAQTGSRTGTISLGRVDGNYYYSGAIDSVKIYNYARTPAQIAYDYNRGAPLAHWRLDECEGSTSRDSSGNNYTGTLTITATGGNTNGLGTCSTSTSAWGTGTVGKFNASINFDGNGDYIDMGDTLDMLTSSTSLSAWIKTTQNCDYCGIAGKSYYGSKVGRYSIHLRSGGKVGSMLQGSSGNIETISAKTINDGAWHLILAVFDRTNGNSLYIDGKLETATTGNTTADTLNTTDPFRIGHYNNNAALHFNGQIDDVRVYGYALSPDQIKQVYNGGAAVNYGPATGSP